MAAGVLFAQFIHQVRQMGRQFGFERADVLLQSFAHGLAKRPAGLAIDLFAGVGVAVHDGIPLGIRWRCCGG